MLVECAWCGKAMKVVPDSPNHPKPQISHGICPDCLKAVKARDKERKQL